MKALLKKLIPGFVLSAYHLMLAWFAAVKFGFPANRLIVIGVTGTNGKSTTANMIARLLEGAGHKVGLTTTANFKIAEREWLNDQKMTMLGRTQLQSLLKEMVEAGCRYAVIETSSEGIKQHRHAGINYDVAVFTNLTPEHIESHGSFEKYKRAKGKLFAKLSRDRRKSLNGKQIPKVIVANALDPAAEYFLSFKADRKIGFAALKNDELVAPEFFDVEVVAARKVIATGEGASFSVGGTSFSLRLPGFFNVENALAAVCAGRAVGLEDENMAVSLMALTGVPGRTERIDEGQPFTVMVDYAPEPESLKHLYQTVADLKKNRIIHVLGSCGGGRDRSRRPVLGRMAAENAELVIVTNEDPYDDDPQEIIDQVAAGAREAGARDQENLFTILDRGEAIDFAIFQAKSGDLVLVTGKGCEQAIAVAGGNKIPWDDRERLRLAIRAKLNQQ
jgi:UDP-N-acetylmuramoyl-L-alanyl-D-glutamate--2,6-diaminopimelate ligase